MKKKDGFDNFNSFLKIRKTKKTYLKKSLLILIILLNLWCNVVADD